MKNIIAKIIGGKAGNLTDKNNVTVVLTNFLLNYVPEEKRHDAQKALVRVCRIYQIDSAEHMLTHMKKTLDDLCPEA